MSHFIDGQSVAGCWMSYINCARHHHEQNLVAVQTSQTGSLVLLCASTTTHILSVSTCTYAVVNLLECTFSATSNNNYEVGTLAVSGWAVTFGTARRPGPGRGRSPPRPL